MTTFNLQALLDGNRRALAKAITLAESKLETHREQAQVVLEQVLPHSGNSIRIGTVHDHFLGRLRDGDNECFDSRFVRRIWANG